MLPADQIPVEFETPLSGWERLCFFLEPLDVRLYVNETCFYDFGSGSLPAFERISFRQPAPWYNGLLGSFGRWCELATDCQITAAGEHDHDQPVNLSFPTLKRFARHEWPLGMKQSQPFRIGSGVVISSGAQVLAGVTVGNGAVIGAGAVVTRDVEPLSIVGGVPAREIRKRPTFSPWWDFDVAYLLSQGERIQEVAASDGPHIWRQERRRLVLRLQDGNYSIEGFTDGDRIAPLHEAPETVRAYLVQAFGEGPHYWQADCWAT